MRAKTVQPGASNSGKGGEEQEEVSSDPNLVEASTEEEMRSGSAWLSMTLEKNMSLGSTWLCMSI